MTRRILVNPRVALAVFLAISLMPAPACADDAARISQLESEIQQLRIRIDQQNRRIERLESMLGRRTGEAAAQRAPSRGAPPQAPANAAPAGPQPWHSPAAWSRVRKGMTEAEVVEILGAPTSADSLEPFRSLFYRGPAAGHAELAGHVNLRDGRVVAVRAPEF